MSGAGCGRVGRGLALAAAALLLAAGAARGQDRLTVVATSPAPRALAAAPDGPIAVTFDRPILGASVTEASFWAFGRWSGPVGGRFSESFDGLSVALVPDRPLSAGEQVTVFLSRDLTAADGTSLRPAGYSFQFWVRSGRAALDYGEIRRLSTRSAPEVTTRAYGGLGSDLDGDGFLDLTIVNEDTNDLRVFLNRGNGSGRFRPFLTPPAAVGAVPSPSEPSDFDRDGHVDVAVANTRDRTVSILLGNGDGTFAPANDVEVGGEPRGLAVLDADGDGDVDVAATSFAEGRVTVLLNDGSGSFTDSRNFGSGGGERALAAGDMDGDGILDLVVGDLAAGEIRVYAGEGGGDFRLAGSRRSGGEVWMLVLGDVDGDAAEDVAAVNSGSNNAAILLGDGAGGLAAPRIEATDDFPLATDLADLDGDGDLDWVVSSFFGDWQLFENSGGDFRLVESFPAPQAASCSLPMDVDGDGALDLVLIDELADEVVLMRNRGAIFASGFESGDTTGWSRARGRLAVVSPGLGGTAHALEVPVGGAGRRAFVETRLAPAEKRLVVEVVLDAGGLELAGGEFEILRLGSGRGAASLRIARHRDRFRLGLWVRERGSGLRLAAELTIRADAPVPLRLEWQSASGASRRDGRAALWRGGGVIGGEARRLDNFGQRIERVRLGLPAGAPAAAGGSFRLDEVVLRR